MIFPGSNRADEYFIIVDLRFHFTMCVLGDEEINSFGGCYVGVLDSWTFRAAVLQVFSCATVAQLAILRMAERIDISLRVAYHGKIVTA